MRRIGTRRRRKEDKEKKKKKKKKKKKTKWGEKHTYTAKKASRQQPLVRPVNTG
jgi:hypothetical protein